VLVEYDEFLTHDASRFLSMLRSTGLQWAVRRALAISLMLLFSLPLVTPLFGSAAEAVIPLCCRRGGKHHCAMPSETTQDSGFGARAVREKCPYMPAGPAVLVLPSFTPSTAASIYAGITRHPAVSPQTYAQLRISFDRARQKRGPPALLV
jgi:hypothetical protein